MMVSQPDAQGNPISRRDALNQTTPVPNTGQTIAVYDPSTEQQIGEILDCGAPAVDAAVARARESFEAGAWTGKTPSERARL